MILQMTIHYRLIENLPKKENVFIYSVPKDYSVNAHKKRAIRFGIEKSKGEINCYY